ncbi:MAG TPA: hypothetical protein VLM40_11165, partial [Gemmata sp.]|nr:hypothetical protein [Gemmata sp.]
MRASRSNPAASQAPTQSAFRFRRSWLVLILALVAIAAGAWYGIREWNRSADRQELLQAARGSSQDIPERLNAYLAREPDDAEMVEALVDWQLRAAVPYSQMEPNLDHLCALRPNDVHAFRVRASFRGRSGRLNEALTDGLRALELDPTDDITRRMVSNIAAESGQFDIAIRELTRLLDSTAFPRNDIAAALVRAQLQAGDA